TLYGRHPQSERQKLLPIDNDRQQAARWQPSSRVIIGSDLDSSRGKRSCWFRLSSLSSVINVSSPVWETPCWRHNPKKERSNGKKRQTMKKSPVTNFRSLLPVSRHQVI